jgi:hypothetical protein
VSENRVLRRIFVPKRDETIAGWRVLHNEVLHKLFSLPNIIRIIKSRRMKWAGHVACMGRGGMRTGFGWESRKERHQWEDLDVGGDNIKMDLREIRRGGVGWIYLARDGGQ